MSPRERDIRQGIFYLTHARNTFRAAGAHRAADYAARALKSAEGALRHEQAQGYARARRGE